MKKKAEIDLKVGVFVVVGVLALMTSILLLGGMESLLTRFVNYSIYYEKTEGLITGAKVVVNGLKAGTVEEIVLDPKRRAVNVLIRVEKKYQASIRRDSEAQILTQGVLGDKYISINVGNDSEPMIEDKGEIRSAGARQLDEFISEGGVLLDSLQRIALSLERILKSFETDRRADRIFEGLANSSSNLSRITKNLDNEMNGIKIKESISHLNSILKKVDNGTGTVGALINDTALYDDAKALVGGVNRNRIMRNLVRKTIKDAEEEENAAVPK